MSAEHDALAYLMALVPPSREGFIELRFRRPGEARMGRRFYPVAHARAAAREAVRCAPLDDVYVAVAFRARRGGGKSAIDSVGVLWADCDDPASVDALDRFDPRPSLVVNSGGGRHAIWLLRDALPIPLAEWANRRIARTLGACQSAVMNAAAILRPPGTVNHKYDPPVPVELIRFDAQRLDAMQVVGPLPALPLEPPRPAHAVTVTGDGDLDPLEEIAPRVYAHLLTGQVAGRDGKVNCPFHDEKTPSCHLYETAAAGWYCFGCRRGGDVYSFGCRVLGIPNVRSARFRLRRALYARLLPGVRVPAWRRSRTRHEARRRSRRAVLLSVSGPEAMTGTGPEQVRCFLGGVRDRSPPPILARRYGAAVH